MQAMLARVLGVGSALPARRVANAELERRVETTDEWIRTRTGIRERAVIGQGERLIDLMEAASRRALEASRVAPAELDAIVVGTVSGEHAFPATSCELQAALGLDRISAFDVAAACSGFLFALSTASAHVRAGDFRTVLVIGADALTTMTNWNDRRTCVLFGDGAGAVVVRAHEGDRGVLASVTHASGSMADLLYVRAGQRGGYDAEPQPEPEACIRMRGPELFRWAVRCMGEVALEALEHAGLSPADVDLVVPHQANLRIINAVADKLEFPPEKIFVNVQTTGNTSAASVPIALDEAVRAGRLREGDVVLLVACGGGLTWAGAALRW
jgi:3-oxoacyl-[acyl-carrier-protein] synthase III